MNPNGKKQMSCWAIAGIVVASVVVFFVIILAAILYPVFAKAREKAHQRICTRNLQQLGSAVRMYAQDYDGKLPPKETWCDALGRYVTRNVEFRCGGAREQRCGYAYNSTMPLVLANVKSPNDTVMMFDAKGDWNTVGNSSIADLRHAGGLNVVFVDGHVRWLKEFPLPTGGPSK